MYVLHVDSRGDNGVIQAHRLIHFFVICSPIQIWSDSLSHIEGLLYDSIMIALLKDCTSESMNFRPCLQTLQYRLCSILSLATLLFLYYLLTQTYIYTCMTISSPNQCTYTIYHCIGCVGDIKDFLYFIAGQFERERLHPTLPTD